VRAILFHVPIVAMLIIFGVIALIDAGHLDGLRSETTFGWMVVVWYPLMALLGLTQVVLWIRWLAKRGAPPWTRSRRARRILRGGLLVLMGSVLAMLAFRIVERWGFRH